MANQKIMTPQNDHNKFPVDLKDVDPIKTEIINKMALVSPYLSIIL